ncbi:hypothetical protein TGRUB_273995 [Toxoplasma gondii RUB]|uniref:CSD domain-containing protein n=1 Tax=Toxoplasma gondii RUB TaxID=935652 RepID=A0A086M507_TOXGO|nr:hypothetical protein TGRUB_273995 [Toxoplasma gondii RUB]
MMDLLHLSRRSVLRQFAASGPSPLCPLSFRRLPSSACLLHRQFVRERTDRHAASNCSSCSSPQPQLGDSSLSAHSPHLSLHASHSVFFSSSSSFGSSEETREAVAKSVRETWKLQRFHSVSAVDIPDEGRGANDCFSSVEMTVGTPTDDACLPYRSLSSSSASSSISSSSASSGFPSPWNSVHGEKSPGGRKRPGIAGSRGRGETCVDAADARGDWQDGASAFSQTQGRRRSATEESNRPTARTAVCEAPRARLHGTIVKVHHHRVCGFVAPDDGGPHIFLHRDDFVKSSSSASSSSSPAGGRKSRRVSASAGAGARAAGETQKVEHLLLHPGQSVTFETSWDPLHNAPRAVRVAFEEERDEERDSRRALGDAWQQRGHEGA